ncbi:MAG: hypothetical protein K6F65_04760 [Lachnospiraceae bacterium]|nr:hypothetical protein [Lachnospiraceae bacterium]
MNENTRKNINEAIAAADETLEYLYEAREYLGKAGRLGILDMFGGGLIIGMTKHKRIDAANACLRQAKASLRKLNRELHDIPGYTTESFGDGFRSVDASTNAFLLDVMSDNMLSDYLVQESLNDTRDRNEKLIEQIEITRGILKDKLIAD